MRLNEDLAEQIELPKILFCVPERRARERFTGLVRQFLQDNRLLDVLQPFHRGCAELRFRPSVQDIRNVSRMPVENDFGFSLNGNRRAALVVKKFF